jgi:hypothetical protein
MNTDISRLVPKVHPATRAIEPTDPFTLHATPVTGDPEVMLRCVVQEYAWMGWDTEQIFGLFRQPFYPALNALLECYGETGIRQRICNVLGRSGVLRFAETLNENATPDEELEADDGPELIQLRIPEGLRRERPPWRSESDHESDEETFQAETIGTAQRPFPTELRSSHV